MQFADDGYSDSIHENFGSSFVCSMVLIYLPDCTNVCGSRGEELETIGSV